VNVHCIRGFQKLYQYIFGAFKVTSVAMARTLQVQASIRYSELERRASNLGYLNQVVTCLRVSGWNLYGIQR